MRSVHSETTGRPERPCGYMITPGCYSKIVQLGAVGVLVAALAIAASASLYSLGVQRFASQITSPAVLFQR